eukprot:gene10001-biopygen13811
MRYTWCGREKTQGIILRLAGKPQPGGKGRGKGAARARQGRGKGAARARQGRGKGAARARYPTLPYPTLAPEKGCTTTCCWPFRHAGKGVHHKNKGVHHRNKGVHHQNKGVHHPNKGWAPENPPTQLICPTQPRFPRQPQHGFLRLFARTAWYPHSVCQ